MGADFCLLNNVVQAAYTVPIASIADCVPVNLVSSQEVCETPVTNIIIGVEISIEITIINVVNVINGATVTATSTETKTVRHPMTRTSGPVVTSSVGSNGTVYYTTTVACVQCQCPGYVPGQMGVIATKSVCPVCVASTVTPVTATVIPCATPTSCPWYCHPDYWRQAIRIHCSCTSHNCRRCPRPADPSRHCNRCRRQPNIPSYLHWCSFFHQRQGCRLRYRCRSLPFALLVRHS